ncbi:MAG: aminotransferase class I/II-fold pyridoxal phosphate-dependent enzyme [Bacteroidota bacterium]
MKFEKANRLKNVEEYYFSTKLREVRSLINEGKPIINLGIGSPDLRPPQEVIEAISKASLNPNNHGYQSYQGIPELRQSIAKFYDKHFNVKLSTDHEILPLMGSKEGILHISMAFLNKGDSVLIPNPGYPTYASVTKLVEAKPVFYNLTGENNWLPDLESLEKMDLSNVKIMWVNYPHMPTGTNPTDELFKKLIVFAKKHSILLVNDNPYSFILNDDPKSILSFEGAKEVAIELNSLSKTFNMAGWRVGMVLGNEENLKNILQVKSNMDSGMYFGIQKGAIAALNLSEEWLKGINDIYTKRREIVWKICDALQCSYDKSSSGLFVWAKIQNGKKSIEVTDNLLYDKNIFVAPGTVFGDNGEGYIRFSICVVEEKLQEVLTRVS